MFAKTFVRIAGLALTASAMVGCAGRPSIVPNNDPALRKTSAQFAADAVKRFPYPGAATETANGQAEPELMREVVQIVNFSKEDWTDLDFWINGAYVVHVPKIEAYATDKPGTRTLDFQMFFNEKGQSFDTDKGKNPIKTVEMNRDGKMYKFKIVIN